VYVLPVTAPGGEPRALTAHLNGAASPAWSPDGHHIAYLAPMNAAELAKEDRGEQDPAPVDSLEAKQRKERQEEDEKNRFDPRPVHRIPYRQGTSYMDDRQQHIYLIATADEATGAAARPRRLTQSDYSYGPPRWSPDGTTIYSIRPKRPDTDEFWRENNIFRLNVADGSETRLVDEGHFAVSVLPAPDGAWLAGERILYNTTDTLPRLTLYPLNGGEPVDINLRLDREVSFYDWTAGGSLIVALASEGDHDLYELHPQSQTAELLDSATRMIGGLHVSASGSIAFIASTPQNPSELYFRPAGGGAPRPITRFNQPFLEEVIVQETHEIRFMSPDGVEIQGWYLLPVGYASGQNVPLALNIHGGPHLMWGAGMASMWHEWQTHAARGYAVFYCNPRGSGGYGEAHLRGLHAAWGPVALRDVLAGVAAMLATGMIDPDRLAITGGSYGGYLTAWIIAHDDRFKAAVAQRGVYNLVSFYGTSDVPILIDNEFDAQPWTDHQRLWENSPVAHAHRIKTPLLLLHAENDFRVPIEQGEQMFAFVRRSGGTVHMIRYPREGHELTRTGEPAHRLSHLSEQIAWFERYCPPGRPAE
jgi:dipeptidyl aminopeptidase/acylaminoacyl peptidase